VSGACLCKSQCHYAKLLQLVCELYTDYSLDDFSHTTRMACGKRIKLGVSYLKVLAAPKNEFYPIIYTHPQAIGVHEFLLSTKQNQSYFNNYTGSLYKINNLPLQQSFCMKRNTIC